MKHGTFYGGFKKYCKCEQCRAFRNSYMKQYRRKIKERKEAEEFDDIRPTETASGRLDSVGQGTGASATPGARDIERLRFSSLYGKRSG
jgi:hypothetical protein